SHRECVNGAVPCPAVYGRAAHRRRARQPPGPAVRGRRRDAHRRRRPRDRERDLRRDRRAPPLPPARAGRNGQPLTRSGSANARSGARSWGRAKPDLMVASAAAVNLRRYSARDGYSWASRSAVNGLAEPSSRQIVDGFGPGAPDSAATGTSTGGVRMPPSAMPSAVRLITGVTLPGVTSIRGAIFGGGPSTSHVVSARKAALATRCIG